jgi:hypothetical protein
VPWNWCLQEGRENERQMVLSTEVPTWTTLLGLFHQFVQLQDTKYVRAHDLVLSRCKQVMLVHVTGGVHHFHQ